MKRLLYFISKTDREIIQRCGDDTRMHQRGLGFFVLITALFAFASGFYALSSIFGHWNYMTMGYDLTIKQLITTISCALLYALMIGAIDREIVSSKSKFSALLRLPLAVIIGIVISIPIELKILEERIHQKIHENHVEKMMPLKQQKDEYIEKIDQEINDIEVQIAYYSKLKLEASQKVANEDLGLLGDGLSGQQGKGKFWGYAVQERDNYAQEVQKLEDLKQEKLDNKAARLQQLETDYTLYEVKPVFDLWEKYLVMHQIIREDETEKAKSMARGITFLFILLELIPSIIKLLSSKNEYDLILEYRYQRIQNKLKRALEEDDDEPLDFISLPELRIKRA